MSIKKSLFADGALLGITFVWGATFIIVQDVLDKLPPLTFNAWRFLLAALALFFWQLWTKNRSRQIKQGKSLSAAGPGRTGRRFLSLILAGSLLGFFLFVGYACQTIGLLYTSASNAAFITGLSVVLVPILSALLLKRRPPATAVIGVMAATGGLFFLTTKGAFSINRGDTIVIACALAFALHIIFTAKVTEHFASLSLTIVQLSVCAILSFFCGLVFDGYRRLFDFQTLTEPSVLLVCLFMALAATACAFLLQTALQKYTPPTHVGIIYIMEPVFAALTSVVVQHVALGAAEMAGCALILAGMALAEWPAGSRRRRTRTRSRRKSLSRSAVSEKLPSEK
ncbi:DMT family transporter [Terrilactibacillus sp. S3-3]|nr:DMT family transporter [Terrilactibacillus sp. S3-3]